jgi:hypothetical protein
MASRSTIYKHLPELAGGRNQAAGQMGTLAVFTAWFLPAPDSRAASKT